MQTEPVVNQIMSALLALLAGIDGTGVDEEGPYWYDLSAEGRVIEGDPPAARPTPPIVYVGALTVAPSEYADLRATHHDVAIPLILYAGTSEDDANDPSTRRRNLIRLLADIQRALRYDPTLGGLCMPALLEMDGPIEGTAIGWAGCAVGLATLRCRILLDYGEGL